MTELEKAQGQVSQLAAEVTTLKVQLAYQRTVFQGLIDMLKSQYEIAEAEIVRIKAAAVNQQSDFEQVNNQLQAENNNLRRLIDAHAAEDQAHPTDDTNQN